MKKKIVFLLFTMFIILSISTTYSAKRPFSIEDLYKLKSYSDLSISPDGNQLLFTLKEYKLKEGKSFSNIYLLNLKDGKLKKITFNKGKNYSPFFSPDGKKIYYISTKDGNSPQLYVLRNLSEPEKITNFYTGINSPIISRDGKFVLFNSDVFPECKADSDCNKRILKAMEEGPVQAHLADDLLYRHWTFYKDGKITHTFLLNLETKKIEDLTPGKFDTPPFSLGGDRGYTIDPNLNYICFVSNHDKCLACSTNNDLFLYNIKSKKITNITKENKAYDGDPSFSPNGRYIAFKMQKIPGYESDRFRLAIYDIKSKKIEILTEEFDHWVDSFKWGPDSRYIYFISPVKGNYVLYRVNIKDKNIEEILNKNTIRDFVISPNGNEIYILHSSISTPYEIYSYSLKSKKLKRLTFLNKKIEDEVDIRPAEIKWFKGSDGVKIQTFIIKPHNFDPNKKYPLILNIHGGPQQMWADSFRGDWQVYPAKGYVVAFCNPHGSPGYGQEFVAEISKDWGGKAIEDILKVTQQLAKLPYVDEKRMGAMGWSWGGYAIMWLEGHTTKFKALAAMMGVYDLRSMYGATEELWFPEWDLGGTPWTSPLYEKFSPSNFVKNFKTPCLVITGERDYRVPYTQSLQFFTDLRKMDVPARLIIFKNDGHWPNWVKSMVLYYDAHLDWFHKYLGGGKPPYDVKKLVRNLVFQKEK